MNTIVQDNDIVKDSSAFLGGGVLRVLEHPHQLWHNSQFSI